MTQKTVNPADLVAIVGVIDPDANAAATYTTGWIDMANTQQILAVISAGILGTLATLDAKIEQATDASGTGTKDVAGAAITQLTKAGSDDDKQAVIGFFAEDLDVNNDFNHVRLSMTVGTATSDCGAMVLGMGMRYGPASGQSLASVDEIVRV